MGEWTKKHQLVVKTFNTDFPRKMTVSSKPHSPFPGFSSFPPKVLGFTGIIKALSTECLIDNYVYCMESTVTKWEARTVAQ